VNHVDVSRRLAAPGFGFDPARDARIMRDRQWATARIDDGALCN